MQIWVAAASLSAADVPFTIQMQGAGETHRPPSLACPQVKTPPVIDGHLDDPVWREAGVIDRFASTPGDDANLCTAVRIAFDDSNLYIAFDCEEPQMDRLVVTADAGEDKWPGDCVEVFIDPVRSRKHYYQFVTSASGAHADYYNGNRSWDGQWRVKSARTNTGWSTEMSIPWKDMGISNALLETEWGFNVTRRRSLIARGDDPAKRTVQSWAPMQSFDNPRLFGSVFFGSEERKQRVVQSIKLRAALDKQIYNTLHPVAHLVVETENGDIADANLQVAITSSRGEVISQDTQLIPASRMGVDVPIAHLQRGQYTLSVMATTRTGNPSNTVALPLTIERAADVTRSGSIALRQVQPVQTGVDQWHVRAGVPFPEGALTDPNHVQILDAQSNAIAADVYPLATWSRHGSIKWLGVDFQTSLSPEAQRTFTLQFGDNIKRDAAQGIAVQQDAEMITVDTGAATFAIRRQGFNFIDRMTLAGRDTIVPGLERGPYMVGEDGKVYWGSLDTHSEVTVEHQTSLKTVVRAEGWHVDTHGARLGRYVVRLYFYHGLEYIRAQHTFIIAEDTNKIRYRDIGLKLPVAGDDYNFGIGRGTGDASLLQYNWNTYTSTAGDGEQAPGIVARNDLAVIVRDFWQNFPKQLSATRDALTVHFWPAEGKRAWSEVEEVQLEAAYLLPFVHQGDLLDFKVPDRYYTGPLSQEYGFSYPDGKGGWRLHYGGAAQKTNALGLGKTHDMLIAFGDAASDDNLTALREVFQTGVHFLPDSQWTSATKVVGPLPTVDAKRFPRQESLFSEGFDFLMRWTFDMTRAYGMFNYGDSYHGPTFDHEWLRPSYYRLWAGYHHGRARVPWLLYLRSGDAKYLTWARANTQHLMDVDTCHFTLPDSRNWSEYGLKEIGGLCDYKGYVHWASGSRVGDYNNMLDFLQWDFYLTGNRRALDVMHETGQLLIRRAQGGTRREAASLGALLHYYQHTQDPAALLKFARELPRCYAKPASEHHPPSVQWGPYIEPWIAQSGNAEAEQFLLQLADDVMDPAKAKRRHHQFYGDGRALAMAYEMTGDLKYLRHGWAYYNAGPGMMELPGHPLHHFADWLNYSFETQQCLPLMAKIAELPHNPTPAETPYFAAGPYLHLRNSKTHGEIVISIFEDEDQAFKFGGGRVWTRQDLQYELLNPNGEIVQAGVIPKGEFPFGHVQNSDGVTGEYRLRVFGPDEFNLATSHISTLAAERFHLPGERNYLTGRWYFYVPRDCEQFTMTIDKAPVRERRPIFEVVDPDDRVAVHVTLAPGETSRLIEVKPTAAQRGKVWSIATQGCPLIAVEGIPAWLASSYKAALPREKETP